MENIITTSTWSEMQTVFKNQQRVNDNNRQEQLKNDCEMLRNEFARFIEKDYFERVKKDATVLNQCITGPIFTLKSFDDTGAARATCDFNLPKLNNEINTKLNVDVRINFTNHFHSDTNHKFKFILIPE